MLILYAMNPCNISKAFKGKKVHWIPSDFYIHVILKASKNQAEF